MQEGFFFIFCYFLNVDGCNSAYYFIFLTSFFTTIQVRFLKTDECCFVRSILFYKIYCIEYQCKYIPFDDELFEF